MCPKSKEEICFSSPGYVLSVMRIVFEMFQHHWKGMRVRLSDQLRTSFITTQANKQVLSLCFKNIKYSKTHLQC